jgi:hypothetical protein
MRPDRPSSPVADRARRLGPATAWRVAGSQMNDSHWGSHASVSTRAAGRARRSVRRQQVQAPEPARTGGRVASVPASVPAWDGDGRLDARSRPAQSTRPVATAHVRWAPAQGMRRAGGRRRGWRSRRAGRPQRSAAAFHARVAAAEAKPCGRTASRQRSRRSPRRCRRLRGARAGGSCGGAPRRVPLDAPPRDRRTSRRRDPPAGRRDSQTRPPSAGSIRPRQGRLRPAAALVFGVPAAPHPLERPTRATRTSRPLPLPPRRIQPRARGPNTGPIERRQCASKPPRRWRLLVQHDPAWPNQPPQIQPCAGPRRRCQLDQLDAVIDFLAKDLQCVADITRRRRVMPARCWPACASSGKHRPSYRTDPTRIASETVSHDPHGGPSTCPVPEIGGG